ncbi:hypothetical protein NC653_009889 [Populus alba x Populus x berolinensis]|uniref:Uncharacterized protein n=1 Tax=Populus alba x Populus x berolinensis TaxID=444605 RepID=A0AAD6WC72_9ROSI|nr:hypothetical protein NC653_009889 [Populus alba x Populus x berolinensis]
MCFNTSCSRTQLVLQLFNTGKPIPSSHNEKFWLWRLQDSLVVSSKKDRGEHAKRVPYTYIADDFFNLIYRRTCNRCACTRRTHQQNPIRRQILTNPFANSNDILDFSKTSKRRPPSRLTGTSHIKGHGFITFSSQPSSNSF